MDMTSLSAMNRVKMGDIGYPPMHDIKNITITPEILKLIADIDEFKRALETD